MPKFEFEKQPPKEDGLVELVLEEGKDIAPEGSFVAQRPDVAGSSERLGRYWQVHAPEDPKKAEINKNIGLISLRRLAIGKDIPVIVKNFYEAVNEERNKEQPKSTDELIRDFLHSYIEEEGLEGVWRGRGIEVSAHRMPTDFQGIATEGNFNQKVKEQATDALKQLWKERAEVIGGIAALVYDRIREAELGMDLTKTKGLEKEAETQNKQATEQFLRTFLGQAEKFYGITLEDIPTINEEELMARPQPEVITQPQEKPLWTPELIEARIDLEKLNQPKENTYERASKAFDLEQLAQVRNRLNEIYTRFYRVPEEPTKKSPQPIRDVYRRYTRILDQAFEKDFQKAIEEAYQLAQLTRRQPPALKLNLSQIDYLRGMEQRLAVREMFYQEQAKETIKAEQELKRTMEGKQKMLQEMRPPLKKEELYKKWAAANRFVNQFYFGGLAQEVSRLPEEGELYKMRQLVDELVRTNNVREQAIETVIADSLTTIVGEYTPGTLQWWRYQRYFYAFRRGTMAQEHILRRFQDDEEDKPVEDRLSAVELADRMAQLKRNLRRMQILAEEDRYFNEGVQAA